MLLNVSSYKPRFAFLELTFFISEFGIFLFFWYLSRGPQHHQLNSSPGVSFRRHGAPQSLHGGVVGTAQQRLAIYCDQLIVDAQPAILVGEKQHTIVKLGVVLQKTK